MWQAYLTLAWTIVPVMIVIGAFFVVRVLRELEAQHRTLAAMAERLARAAPQPEGGAGADGGGRPGVEAAPSSEPRAESPTESRAEPTLGAAELEGAVKDAVVGGIEQLGERFRAELARDREASAAHFAALTERLEALAHANADGAAPGPSVAAAPSDPDALLERAMNRLVAQGFEQIDFVTPRDEVGPDATVVVEAKRNGMVHKGRVTLRAGAVTDVDLRPAHGLFP